MSLPDPSGLNRKVPRPVRNEIGRDSLLEWMLGLDCALVALVAPAGYGKTTLLARCARQVHGRGVWLSLREDDADPLALCSRLADALLEVLPTLSLERYGLTRDAGSGAAARARALAEDLAYSTTNLIFFLDGADALQEAAEDWLGQWLDALAEGHRVFLSSRAEPRLGLARRVAAGTAERLGIEHLTFTAEETAACLKALPEDVNRDHVHTRLEGWPIGINLVAAGVAPGLTPEQVMREVLSQLAPQLRATLPEAAVLELWTDEAAATHHLALPPEWLQASRLAGLPLSPLGEAYRPHQLLREVLDAELRRQGARYTELHQRAGEYAEAQGDEWRALDHFRRAGRHEALLRVAERLARTYEARWEHRLVRQVLEAVPESKLPGTLRALLGRALFETGESARGEGLLRQLYGAGDRDPGLLFSLGVLAARAGQPAAQLTLAQEGLGLPHTARDAARLTRLQASALLALGEAPRAVEVGCRALERARAENDSLEVGAVLLMLQLAYREAGDLVSGEAALRWALQLHQELGIRPRMLLAQNDLADLLREQGRFDEALAIVSEALPLAEQEHSVIHPLLLETRADVAYSRGHLSAATADYREALTLCDHFGLDALRSRILPCLTEVAVLQGDLASAQQTVSLGRLATMPTREAQAALVFCDGLLARERGDWSGAEQAFTALTLDGSGPPEPLGLRSVLYRADARAQSGRFTAQDVESLQAMLTRARRVHFHLIDAPVIKAVSTVCARLGGPAVDAWRELMPLEEPGAGPSTRSVDLSPPALVLRVRTLGALQVAVGDQPVHIPLSRSAEVLVWLALYGEGSRDEIMDDLWDGSREQRHIEYFKVAVRHLRLALSGHPVVTFNPLPFEGGRYRLATLFTIDVDAAVVKRSLLAPASEALQEALRVYRGPFLPSSEAEWVAVLRTDLLEQTLSAALILAARLEDSAPVEAAAVYERCLELDPLHESSHVSLIRLWHTLGEQEAARRTFTRYRSMLHDEWGRLPPPDLLALFVPS